MNCTTAASYSSSFDKFDSLHETHFRLQKHINLAIDVARQGIAQLKNDKSILPLSTDKYKNIV